MNKGDRIFVAGNRGLVGSALVRQLRVEGYHELILRGHEELDLLRQDAVEGFFSTVRPDYVFMAAARVGGILANDSLRGDFIRDNLLIQTHVIDAAHRHGTKKLLFLGSSCIYPKHAPQPIKEEYLLSGPLEPTNQPYAIAKLAGIEMISAYRDQYGFHGISVMPTNLYGPNDNFDPLTSHALAALVRRFCEAVRANSPEVVVWGTGVTRREFLHVDDLAAACVFLMGEYDQRAPLNIGVGEDITIRELAELIGDVAGYRGALRFDPSKPEGTPRKLLDVSRIRALGWTARVPLRLGLEQTYRWYAEHTAK